MKILFLLNILLIPTLSFSQDRNYLFVNEIYPPGELGATEAGAVVARVDDPSASWHNPAGLAKINTKFLTGSLSANSQTEYNIKKSSAQKSYDAIPSFAAYAFLINEFRIAISVVTPVKYRLSTSITKSGDLDSDTSSTFHRNASSTFSNVLNYEQVVPSLSFGYPVTSSFRVGSSIQYMRTNFGQAFKLSETSTADSISTGIVSISNFEEKYVLSQLRGQLGIQWDPNNWLSFGINVKSPTKLLNGKGELRFTEQTNSFSTTNNHTVISQSVRFPNVNTNIRYPWEINLGTALTLENFQFELTLNHATQSNESDFIAGEILTGKFWSQSNGNLPNINTTFLNTFSGGLKIRSKKQTNVAIGSNIKIGNSLFHIGHYLKRGWLTLKEKGDGKIIDDPFPSKIYGYTGGFTFFHSYGHSTLGFQFIKSEDSSSELVGVSSNAIVERIGEGIRLKIYSIMLGSSFYL